VGQGVPGFFDKASGRKNVSTLYTPATIASSFSQKTLRCGRGGDISRRTDTTSRRRATRSTVAFLEFQDNLGLSVSAAKNPKSEEPEEPHQACNSAILRKSNVKNENRSLDRFPSVLDACLVRRKGSI
jgi:hypothetical protein